MKWMEGRESVPWPVDCALAEFGSSIRRLQCDILRKICEAVFDGDEVFALIEVVDVEEIADWDSQALTRLQEAANIFLRRI